MPFSEENVLDFVKWLEKSYFVERALGRIEKLLAPEFMMVGTGRREVCYDMPQMRFLLQQEQSGFHDTFLVLSAHYSVRTLTPEVFSVCGELVVRENNESCEMLDLPVRVTIILRAEQGCLLLSQLHLSLPSPDQDDAEFFPRLLVGENISTLRRLADERSAELRERNRDLDALMNNIPGGVMCCDATDELNLLQFSDGLLSMLGYTREELGTVFHNRFSEMIYEPDIAPTWEAVHAQLEKGNTKLIEYRMARKDGGLIWVQDRGQLMRREDGREVFYCILLDITETKKAQEDLRLSLERHQIIMDQTNDIIFEWQVKQDTLTFSPNWEKKFGYEPVRENVHARLLDNPHLHPDDVPLLRRKMSDILEREPYQEAELRIQKRDGGYLWCRVRATLQKDRAGEPAKAVGVILDIDAEKREAQRMRERAERDTLTGLYNKGTMEAKADHALGALMPGENAVLLMIDIDNFKQVNDFYGHLSGDVMLTEAARMLQDMFRASDILGRIGGDEFTVLLRGSGAQAIAGRKAQEVLDAFARLLPAQGGGPVFSCSVGIAQAPQDGTDYLTLYKKADAALYRAKMQGKNTYAFYTQLPLEGLGAPTQSTVGQTIDSELGTGVMRSSLAEYVFHILYQSDDVEKAIPSVLEIVGRHVGVSRVYIFEDSEDGTYCDNTFEWCNDGIVPQIDQLQHMLEGELADYYKNFNEDGIFYCRDIHALPPNQVQVLEAQGIKSMLQCVIRDDGKPRGYIGFDECRESRFWTQEQTDLLCIVAEIVSVYLLKARARTRLTHALQGAQAILDSQDAWLYVIRKGTYELLYANKKTMQDVPGAMPGEPCYRVFYRADKPCVRCPLVKLAPEGPDRVTARLYSEVLDMEVTAVGMEIPWAGGEDAYLMACEKVKTQKKK